MRFLALALTLALLPSSASAQILNLAELNTEQITALEQAKTVVIVPGGILEEHGPYLPSGSDSYQSERHARGLAERLVARPGWTVVMFPQIPLGSGSANGIGGKYAFPGSYGIRNQTVRAVYMDLADALGADGFHWIFLVHNHGYPAQNAALEQSGDYFHDTYGGQMVHLFGLMAVRMAGASLADELSEAEKREEGFSVHAGFRETSDVLFVRPDLVDPAYRRARPMTGANFADLVKMARQDDWPGYFGSPRLASAARGAKDFELTLAQLTELAVRILEGYDYRRLPRYAKTMLQDPSEAAVDHAALAHDAEQERRQRAWLRKKGLE